MVSIAGIVRIETQESVSKAKELNILHQAWSHRLNLGSQAPSHSVILSGSRIADYTEGCESVHVGLASEGNHSEIRVFLQDDLFLRSLKVNWSPVGTGEGTKPWVCSSLLGLNTDQNFREETCERSQSPRAGASRPLLLSCISHLTCRFAGVCWEEP